MLILILKILNPHSAFRNYYAAVAQLAELLFCKQLVAGSTPVGGANFRLLSLMAEHPVFARLAVVRVHEGAPVS